MTRIQKLEKAVQAGLGLRKAMEMLVTNGPMYSVAREVVEKYDEVIESLKDKPKAKGK